MRNLPLTKGRLDVAIVLVRDFPLLGFVIHLDSEHIPVIYSALVCRVLFKKVPVSVQFGIISFLLGFKQPAVGLQNIRDQRFASKIKLLQQLKFIAHIRFALLRCFADKHCAWLKI